MVENRLYSFFIISILFVFAGCSLDYSGTRMPEDLSEMVPETVFIDFTQVQVEDGAIQSRLEARKAENYTRKKEMVLENVRFEEYGDDEELITVGNADRAVLHTDTDDAELSGNIRFYSLEENTTIEASNLYWNAKEETLQGGQDDTVTVIKDDGSRMEGKGFRTDFTLREIVFSNGVTGIYVKEEEAVSGD